MNLAGIARKLDVRICNLLGVLRKNIDEDLYYPADGHWKARAHSLAAEAIRDYLAGNGLIGKQQ